MPVCTLNEGLRCCLSDNHSNFNVWTSGKKWWFFSGEGGEVNHPPYLRAMPGVLYWYSEYKSNLIRNIFTFVCVSVSEWMNLHFIFKLCMFGEKLHLRIIHCDLVVCHIYSYCSTPSVTQYSQLFFTRNALTNENWTMFCSMLVKF